MRALRTLMAGTAAMVLVTIGIACARGQSSGKIAAGPATSSAADSFPAPPHAVAPIVSSRWSDEAERDRDHEVDSVAQLLHIRAGSAVADVGAGSGYYTVRLSHVVGPAGHVYAEDITPDYVNALRQRVAAEHDTNVQVVLGTADDPRLPANAVDVALLVHMYHEVRQPFALLTHLDAALRRGASVAIVDVDRATDAHGTPPALLRCEVEAVGFHETGVHQLRRGYLAVFSPPDSGGPTPPNQIRGRLARAGCPTTSS